MTQERPIRILLADDHQLVRLGLSTLINIAPDMEVVGEAEDGDEVVAMFTELAPDIVVMDSRMPCQSGIEATRKILGVNPDARILMLTAFDGDTDIRRALEAGVSGYILKRSTADNLLPAIREIAKGRQWLPKEVTRRLASKTSFEQLTPRELDVLNEIAKGLSNKEIAETLGITLYTTKEHVKNILAKLRVGYRTEAVAVAIKRGIIEL